MWKQQVDPAVTIPKLNPGCYSNRQTVLPSLREAGFPMPDNKTIVQTSSTFKGTRSDQVYNPVMLHKQRLTAKDLRLKRMELVQHIQDLLIQSREQSYITNNEQIGQQSGNDSQTFICAVKLERQLFDASKCIDEHFNIVTLRTRIMKLYATI